MTNDYLESVKKQFEYYKMLGDKTFAQLSDEQLFWQYNEESNAISTIVKHLWGKGFKSFILPLKENVM